MTKTVIKKDRRVEVRTKTGGSYVYSCSTLAEIHRYLEETGQRYEAFIKKVDGEDYMFIRKLSKGEDTIVELQGAKIPPVTGIQDYGGVLTSVRRFSLLMAYGLACEEGDLPPDARPGSEDPKDKWKRMHTSSSSNPVSEKQKILIRNLCERLGRTSAEALSLIAKCKNATEASNAIDSLHFELEERSMQ